MTPGPCENGVVIYDDRNGQWLLFRSPLRIYVVHDPESVVSTLHEIENQVRANGLYAAGFVSYEAAPAFDPAFAVHSPGDFPLLWFGVYREPEKISLPSSQQDLPHIPWKPSVSESEYQYSIGRIKDYIGAGDTYQANYTFRLQAPFADDPWKLFVRMICAQGCGYGAFVNAGDWAVCSSSPELFFKLCGHVLRSKPMKGTAPRGLTQAQDLEQAAWLAKSEKNRAENVMIVDMVRNDMGRIADIGSVEVPSLFDIEKYPTLWQMTSTVRCKTRASITDIFCALFPAASITGAPKVRTMQIISELESTPRKVYTGTVGFLLPESRAQFNVAIRTVIVDRRNNTAEYGTGGGIVWDSEKGDEFEECYTKARVLTRATPDFSLLETILWTPQGGYFLLDAHLKRLADSADYFSWSIDIETIREKLNALSHKLPPHPHRIRLLVSKNGEPVVEPQMLPPLPQPYRIRLAGSPVDPGNHFLYHKTTHRYIYEQAMANAPGYSDVLLWNKNGEITESCIANVVVEMNGELLTPPVQSGLLPGIYRSYLLEQGRVREGSIKVKDLWQCTRIYLANSVRGMWEVSLDPTYRP